MAPFSSTNQPGKPGHIAAGSSKPYGDVAYADPGYLPDKKKRYPIDAKHVKAAWSYINQSKNASRYTPAQLASIKKAIMGAMKRHGHDIYQVTGENAMAKMRKQKAKAADTEMGEPKDSERAGG